MRECSEYEITIEKLLNVVHSYTNPIRISVIIGDAWLTCEEARGTRRLHDFYLTKAHTKYDDEEKERLLKYYKDVPVWNITAWHDVDCREIRYGIEARCYYKDVREGYLAEKADLKRAKERERRKKKREQTGCIRSGRRNVMRLIDADAIQIPKTHADAFENCRNCELLDADQVREIIDSAPTIEPKRGEWIDYECGSGCYCSNCGWDGDDIIDECIIQDFGFCPNCGARMKGADDETD